MIYPFAPLSEMSDGRYWCAEQFVGRYDVHIFDTVDCFKVWRPAASGKIVMIHNVTGRRWHTEQHLEADYVLPVMPPTMVIYQMLESELGE
jgi:hypothetical protein